MDVFYLDLLFLEERYATSTIQAIKLRRLRGAGHIARVGESRGAYRVYWGNPREGDDLKDPRVDGRLLFKWILVPWVRGRGTHWIAVAQDRDRWRAVVNAAMKLRVP